MTTHTRDMFEFRVTDRRFSYEGVDHVDVMGTAIGVYARIPEALVEACRAIHSKHQFEKGYDPYNDDECDEFYRRFVGAWKEFETMHLRPYFANIKEAGSK